MKTYQRVLIHVCIAAFAIGIVGPVWWQAIDREPPWTRLYGTIDPVPAGGELVVHWHTTPLIKICPGTLQIELMSGNLIWPVLQRPVGANKLGSTEYTPAPWPVSRDIPPGLVIYRVTSFWYCNELQETTGWPIVQVGPDVPFILLPEER